MAPFASCMQSLSLASAPGCGANLLRAITWPSAAYQGLHAQTLPYVYLTSALGQLHVNCPWVNWACPPCIPPLPRPPRPGPCASKPCDPCSPRRNSIAVAPHLVCCVSRLTVAAVLYHFTTYKASSVVLDPLLLSLPGNLNFRKPCLAALFTCRPPSGDVQSVSLVHPSSRPVYSWAGAGEAG